MEVNFKEIIRELNNELYEKYNYDGGSFSWLTNDAEDVIVFNRTHIWDSENDTRIFDEDSNEYEPFLPYIKQQFNSYLDSISKLRL